MTRFLILPILTLLIPAAPAGAVYFSSVEDCRKERDAAWEKLLRAREEREDVYAKWIGVSGSLATWYENELHHLDARNADLAREQKAIAKECDRLAEVERASQEAAQRKKIEAEEAQRKSRAQAEKEKQREAQRQAERDARRESDRKKQEADRKKEEASTDILDNVRARRNDYEDKNYNKVIKGVGEAIGHTHDKDLIGAVQDYALGEVQRQHNQVLGDAKDFEEKFKAFDAKERPLPVKNPFPITTTTSSSIPENRRAQAGEDSDDSNPWKETPDTSWKETPETTADSKNPWRDDPTPTDVENPWRDADKDNSPFTTTKNARGAPSERFLDPKTGKNLLIPAGFTLYRASPTAALQVVKLGAFHQGDTPTKCSADGLGNVLTECERKRSVGR
jgi:hypothetical protein